MQTAPFNMYCFFLTCQKLGVFNSSDNKYEQVKLCISFCREEVVEKAKV